MKETSPGVLIMGGGVAGMAAAQLLADFDVSVHVVEKRERLGGHAAMWACMATDACMNCGACLSIEMADQVAGRQAITTHLGTGVLKIQKSENGFDATLENGEHIVVQKIIDATGFAPFDPALIASYHTDRLKNVITTADMNALLKDEALEARLSDNPAPEIAFIQCVGSRNRKLGKDYCSQVCCKVSMRQANKLLHLNPDARITVFYMDLQIVGKEIRSFYEGLSKKVSLVQGVPAEILENSENGKLRIISEDRDDLSRIAREFDLIVLSVGMESAEKTVETSGIPGCTPNGWGFFNTEDAQLAGDVYAAGCARTPGDIMSSMQDGRIAAGRVIEDLDLSRTDGLSGNDGEQQLSVAVFGQAGQAVATASAMAAHGFKTFLLGADSPGDASGALNSLGDARILQVAGTAGNFRIHYQSGSKGYYLTCGAIIAAYDPEFDETDAGVSAKNILTPEAFSLIISGRPGECADDIVILLDYNGPEYKRWARMALKDAITARSAEKNVSVIANKMLVHKAEGQRLYDAARKAGVAFLRYESPADITIQETEKGYSLTVKEATLPSSLDVQLECGCLVLPPKRKAPAHAGESAALLRERQDREGFFQAPNVRHRLTASPRKGIFFAGAGHDETDTDDLKAEIADIETLLKTQVFAKADVDTGVVINEKMCAQCLTCYRICPHRAIVLTEKMKPRIVPDACFSCHLCVANCPAYAINTEAFANDAMVEAAQKDRTTVFACERSAWLAAAEATPPDTVDVVKIPCACRLSTEVILNAMLKGASKIIIAGCYDGNCRSMEGAREAGQGVQQACAVPGVDKAKVVFAPVAANESRKFERIVSKA